jgi:hypothetical protein
MFCRQRSARYGFGILVALTLGVMLLVSPAAAQKVPDKAMQEVIIKTTLLTFNDANVTNNYTVLHAKLSKPFRDQFSPERLQEALRASGNSTSISTSSQPRSRLRAKSPR